MHRLLYVLCLLLPAPMLAAQEFVVTGDDGAALADAVVLLTPLAGARPAPPAEAVIQQVNRTFLPLVTVVPVGSRVAFPNLDRIRHHVYSFSPAKKFDIKLYAGDPPAPVLFDRPGVVVLGCNIHDGMLAFVVVTEAPFFGKTGADGRVRLAGAGAGEYRAQLWHPRLGERLEERRLTLQGGTMPLRLLSAAAERAP